MDVKKKIQLCGFTQNDHLVFSSLLSLLSAKTNAQWELSENDDLTNVVFVDCDTPEGRREALKKEELGYQVIRFSNEAEHRDAGKNLSKPLRAANLLHCLNDVDQPSLAKPKTPSQESNTNIRPHTEILYKLKRWPSKSVIANHPGSPRLCAILMGRHLSEEKAAEMTGVAIEQVHRFIEACIAANCVEQVSPAVVSEVQPELQKKHSGLFAKLRSKLIGNG